MKDKGHFTVSIIKSFIRIVSCAVCAVDGNLSVLAIGFLLAEILGVIEELADQR